MRRKGLSLTDKVLLSITLGGTLAMGALVVGKGSKHYLTEIAKAVTLSGYMGLIYHNCKRQEGSGGYFE